MQSKHTIVAYGPWEECEIPAWLGSVDVHYAAANDNIKDSTPKPEVIVLFDGMAEHFGEEIQRYARQIGVSVYRYISNWGHFAALTQKRQERWVYDLWRDRNNRHPERSMAVETKTKSKPAPKRSPAPLRRKSTKKPPYFKSWRREVLAILLKANKPMTSDQVKELCDWPNATWGLSDLARNGRAAEFVKSEPGPGVFKLYSVTDVDAAWNYLVEDREPDFPMPLEVAITIATESQEQAVTEAEELASVDQPEPQETDRTPDLTPIGQRRYRSWRHESLATLLDRGPMTASELRAVTGYRFASSVLADLSKREDALVDRHGIACTDGQGGNAKAKFVYRIAEGREDAVRELLAAAEKAVGPTRLTVPTSDGALAILSAMDDLRVTVMEKLDVLEDACLMAAEQTVDLQDRLATVRRAVGEVKEGIL